MKNTSQAELILHKNGNSDKLLKQEPLATIWNMNVVMSLLGPVVLDCEVSY